MTLTENIQRAFVSVRSNLVRAALTMLIIALGIMALVGILTALDGILFSLSDNLSGMGANSFSIGRKYENMKGGRGRMRRTTSDPIFYTQAMEFKEKFVGNGKVSVSVYGGSNSTVKFGDNKTNPNVTVFGIDGNTLEVQGYTLETGRGFSDTEIELGTPKVLLGKDIVKLLFDGKPERAINEMVTIGTHRCRVIGVLASKGASMNSSADRQVMIPLLLAKSAYVSTDDYDIEVKLNNATDMEQSSMAAIGVFRQVRNLRVEEADDFEIRKSDGLLDILKENTVTIRAAAIGIGLITLLGAAIGLMNIMLVTVTERTREIGICKALGATKRNIMIQFVAEAVLICQMGGVIGVFLGVLAGLGVAALMDGPFVMPWLWIILGLVLCFVVGVASGLYPAMKAANLDPIEALRYE